MGTRCYLLSFLLCFFGISKVCHAKVDLTTTKPLAIPVDNVTPRITKELVQEIIPTDSTVPQSDTSTMMGRIADRTFNM